MNNIIFLENHNFNKTIKVDSNKNANLYVIDTLEKETNLKIEVYVENNANVDIIISSLNKKKFYKKYNVIIHHLGNNSISTCQVFGVNNDNSHTLFDLEAIIKDNSIGNYCEQSIKGVLLSDDSKIEGKPNLIINTNNIKAKHALAIGRLNPAHIYYLQNKGISKSDAIKLILTSYFNVILYKLDNEKDRQKVIDKIYKEIGDIG